MLQLTGDNEKNLDDVSRSVRRPGVWKEISFGDYICHTFQGDCWADRSPLHEAAAQGRLLALKTLIARGVNVNLVTINRVSSLHEACLGGHVACAKALLENGAQVNGVTVHGATPLFSACCSGSPACVNVLLEFGAKAQLETHLASPIHEAVKRGHRECMEILLAHNVNIDQEVPQLGTPLYVACTHQRVDCVKKLLELGASVDLGQCLDTPLHAAAKQSSVKVIHLLIDYGANLKRRNAQGKCALDLAAPKSSVEQALLLREDPSLEIPDAVQLLAKNMVCSSCLLYGGVQRIFTGDHISLAVAFKGPNGTLGLYNCPPALSQLCRLCVRKCLGRACHQSVRKLHLPEPLQRFLLYQ